MELLQQKHISSVMGSSANAFENCGILVKIHFCWLIEYVL